MQTQRVKMIATIMPATKHTSMASSHVARSMLLFGGKSADSLAGNRQSFGGKSADSLAGNPQILWREIRSVLAGNPQCFGGESGEEFLAGKL
jgi:hypothetical protein